LSYWFIPISPPYFKEPSPHLNELGLPVKDYYSTGDVCKILGLKPDTFRARLRSGYYPEPTHLKHVRKYNLEEIRNIVQLTEELTKAGTLRNFRF